MVNNKSIQIDGLDKLSDMIADNDFVSQAFQYSLSNQTVFLYGDDISVREQMAKWARAGKDAGFTVDKDYSSDYFRLELHIPKLETDYYGFRVTVMCEREKVCTARVVGTETVKKRVVAQQAVFEDQEVEQDVVEWDCHPILNTTEEI